MVLPITRENIEKTKRLWLESAGLILTNEEAVRLLMGQTIRKPELFEIQQRSVEAISEKFGINPQNIKALTKDPVVWNRAYLEGLRRAKVTKEAVLVHDTEISVVNSQVVNDKSVSQVVSETLNQAVPFAIPSIVVLGLILWLIWRRR